MPQVASHVTYVGSKLQNIGRDVGADVLRASWGIPGTSSVRRVTLEQLDPFIHLNYIGEVEPAAGADGDVVATRTAGLSR